jgi:ABC-type microcin C transport system permease subunit YejB
MPIEGVTVLWALYKLLNYYVIILPLGASKAQSEGSTLIKEVNLSLIMAANERAL